LSVLMIFIVLAVTGCGADTYVITDVYSDGSGKRIVRFEIENSELSEVKGGEPALTKVLNDSKPNVFKMNKYRTDSKLYYDFSFDFKDLKELALKSKEITGKDSTVKLDYTGTPFNPQIKFSEDISESDYIQWAVDAVIKAGMVSDTGNMINSKKYLIKLPGNPVGYNTVDEQGYISLGGDKTVTCYESYPIKKMVVDTDIDKDGSIERTVTLTLSKAEADRLEKDKYINAETYFKKSLPEWTFDKSDNGETLDFIISTKADNPEAFIKKVKKVFSNEQLSYAKIINTSALFPKYDFEVSTELTGWLGPQAQLDSEPQFVVNFPGEVQTYYSNQNRVEKTDKKQLLTKGSQIHFTAVVEQTSLLFYALILFGIVFVIAAGVILYKYRNKILPQAGRIPGPAIPANSEIAAAGEDSAEITRGNEGIKSCPGCGAPAAETDRFCLKCGTKLDQ